MAISKGLKKYLDYMSGTNDLKSTKKNKYKILRYYGFNDDEISKVLSIKNMTLYSKLDLGDMGLRGKPTGSNLFSEEEIGIFDKKEVKEIDSIVEAVKGKIEVEYIEEDVTEDVTREDIISHLKDRLGIHSKEDQTPKEDKPARNRGLINVGDRDVKCTLCNGKGWVPERINGVFKKKVCPECLGNSVVTRNKDVSRMDLYDVSKIIPNDYYKDIYFDGNKIRSTHKSLYKDGRMSRVIDEYIDFIENILYKSRLGDLPKKSYYIVTPDGFGKKIFVYELIHNLLSLNYTTTPLLDFYDLVKYLLNPKDYEETINDLISRDVIFLTISSLGDTPYLHRVINYVTDFGERYGVPVIMIGRVNVDLLVRGGYTGAGTLFSSNTEDYDYGHFEVKGFIGKDYNKAYYSQVNRMSGTVVNVDKEGEE